MALEQSLAASDSGESEVPLAPTRRPLQTKNFHSARVFAGAGQCHAPAGLWLWHRLRRAPPQAGAWARRAAAAGALRLGTAHASDLTSDSSTSSTTGKLNASGSPDSESEPRGQAQARRRKDLRSRRPG
jgi:hypothetical protein